jgi:hypothetical protein
MKQVTLIIGLFVATFAPLHASNLEINSIQNANIVQFEESWQGDKGFHTYRENDILMIEIMEDMDDETIVEVITQSGKSVFKGIYSQLKMGQKIQIPVIGHQNNISLVVKKFTSSVIQVN